MDAIVSPGSLSGSLPAVSSKSMAHRLLILAACADKTCEVTYNTSSADIEATRACLDALTSRDGLVQGSEPIMLPCTESGSTLRFLLPVVGALGVEAVFARRGRLAERPLAPLDEQLTTHGMRIMSSGSDLVVSGRLRGGRFVLPGNISSQYISGLLLAAPLLDEVVEVLVEPPLESKPYLDLTVQALRLFGVEVVQDTVSVGETRYVCYAVPHTHLVAPCRLAVEGDWSNSAFWLAAGALEYEGLTVTGLDLASLQGDRAILAALASFGARIARKGDAARATYFAPRAATINVSAIPDLVPPLAAVAAVAPGESRLVDAGRLRLKESDRLQTVCAAITALGGDSHVEGDDLVVCGVPHLTGGTVDAANDHRIAMMAAIMATHASGPVRVLGADCVRKSYPAFWDDYRSLGGHVQEQ